MNAVKESGASARTKIERTSDREFVVTRTFDAPARLVFEAWTKPELFTRWWVPKSIGASLTSCELDARTGGTYRLVFASGAQSMTFHGRYLEVIPDAKLVWTNEETEDGSVTTVTFEEKDGKTLLIMSERYSSKEALEANSGNEEGMPETFGQLDELLATLRAS